MRGSARPSRDGSRHFESRVELSAALLDRFVGEFNAALPPADWRAEHVEDAWLLLHLLLETVWRHRFLFRDLSGGMSRGAYEVLMLVAPFLQVESRVHLERLALEYLARR